jgi:hypothetical protein
MAKKSVNKVYNSDKINDLLIENFTKLQKNFVNLDENFNSLSNQLSKLLELFEDAARKFNQTNSDSFNIDKENEFSRKIDELSRDVSLIREKLERGEEPRAKPEFRRTTISLPSQRAEQNPRQSESKIRNLGI